MPEDEPSAVQRLREYVDRMAAARDLELNSLRDSLAVNTALTTEIKLDLASLRASAQPVLDAMETMEAGIRMMGRLGRFGEKFGRLVMFVVALGVIVKFVIGGASWSDVAHAFARAMGK